MRELVWLGILFSDTEMVVGSVDCFSKRAGLVVFLFFQVLRPYKTLWVMTDLRDWCFMYEQI